MYYIRNSKGLRVAEIWCADQRQKKIESESDIVIYNNCYNALFQDDDIIVIDVHHGCTLMTKIVNNDKAMLNMYQSGTRYEIRRALRDGVETRILQSQEISDDIIREFDESYKQMHEDKNLKVESVYDLLYTLKSNNSLLLSMASVSGVNVAYHTYVLSSEYARLLHSVSLFRNVKTSQEKNMVGCANRLLHHKDIMWLASNGCEHYDWGGISNTDELKGIDEFKKSFGGALVSRHNYKIYTSLLGKLAAQITYKNKSEIKEQKNCCVYICHNLLSVYKSWAFHKLNYSEWGYHIVYCDRAVKLNDCTVTELEGKVNFSVCTYPLHDNNTFKRFFVWSRYARKLYNVVKKYTVGSNRTLLFLYLDHWEFMPTVAERFLKENKSTDNQLCILDEGLGMYSPYEKVKTEHYLIKQVLFHMLGLSTYCLDTCTIAAHPGVTDVYCMDVDKLAALKKTGTAKIKYEGDVFTKELTSGFLSIICSSLIDNKENITKYEIVFLTQPIFELIGYDNYTEVLNQIFKSLGGRKILIKKHPRDEFDYSAYISPTVDIMDSKYDIVPFECLYPYFDEAVLITFNSSCCNNVNPRKKSIFMYRIIDNKAFLDLCDNIDIDKNKIIVIDNLSELKCILEASLGGKYE